MCVFWGCWTCLSSWAQPGATPHPVTVELGTESQHLSNGSPDWHETSLQLNRPLGERHLVDVTLLQADRFGLRDEQILASDSRPWTGKLVGALDASLSSHWGLVFSRHGGIAGWVAFPFMVLFEWVGPLIELGGYLFMLFAFFLDLISWQAFSVFLFAAIGLGILLSASGLLLEEMSFGIYPKLRHLALLALMVVVENFGYRQLNSWWRLVGLFRWVTQQEGRWGDMKRKGNWQRDP